ncbi:Asp-tRNA(Asn)/Glu-tRNA(Gln) amidotransferase subunit GatC [Candidatus Parcubacteria bacterium]|nr:Asp-tRNA(Asn)/Glu-tRNA(Gln) amidotransferase subunit GatC [Candidatus Parcubacteria bacterium]
MSRIGTSEVKRVAALAHIGLSDEEAARMAVELDRIVGFVEQLQDVDTAKVPATSQVTGLADVTRLDEVRPCAIGQDALLANAPRRQDGYIKVRRVL